MIRLLYFGDIVGKTGLVALNKGIKQLQQEFQPDFIFANANSTTNGFGLGKIHAYYLRKIGIDAVILHDNAFAKKDLVECYSNMHFLVRPSNYNVGIGKGFKVLKKDDKSIAVVSYVGITNQNRKIFGANPFFIAKDNIEFIKKNTSNIIVSYFSSTTSERQIAFEFFNELGVVGVVGAGSKVLTSDSTILDNKTAIITDNGRCGSIDSVGGMSPKIEIERFLTSIPRFTYYGTDNPELQGVVIDIESGYATKIEMFRRSIQISPDELDKTNEV